MELAVKNLSEVKPEGYSKTAKQLSPKTREECLHKMLVPQHKYNIVYIITTIDTSVQIHVPKIHIQNLRNIIECLLK